MDTYNLNKAQRSLGTAGNREMMGLFIANERAQRMQSFSARVEAISGDASPKN
jgi:hypothetical protein